MLFQASQQTLQRYTLGSTRIAPNPRLFYLHAYLGRRDNKFPCMYIHNSCTRQQKHQANQTTTTTNKTFSPISWNESTVCAAILRKKKQSVYCLTPFELIQWTSKHVSVRFIGKALSSHWLSFILQNKIKTTFTFTCVHKWPICQKQMWSAGEKQLSKETRPNKTDSQPQNYEHVKHALPWGHKLKLNSKLAHQSKIKGNMQTGTPHGGSTKRPQHKFPHNRTTAHNIKKVCVTR